MLERVSEFEGAGFTIDLSAGASDQLDKMARELAVASNELQRSATNDMPFDGFEYREGVLEGFEAKITNLIRSNDNE